MDSLREALKSLKAPYWIGWDTPPFDDFNREIIQPGENETFPDGAIGIRADDDFWTVAALPLSFMDTPLPKIVEAVWPRLAESATFGPDVGAFHPGPIQPPEGGRG